MISASVLHFLCDISIGHNMTIEIGENLWWGGDVVSYIWDSKEARGNGIFEFGERKEMMHTLSWRMTAGSAFAFEGKVSCGVGLGFELVGKRIKYERRDGEIVGREEVGLTVFFVYIIG